MEIFAPIPTRWGRLETILKPERRGAREPFSRGLLRRLPSPPRKVAVLRASRLGGFLCATPALRALRAALPKAEITLIGLPSMGELAQRIPAIDRFESFPGYVGFAEQRFDPRQLVWFFQRMQGERYELVIQMHNASAHANSFALMLGGRITAGFVCDASSADRLDAALKAPEDLDEIRRLLALVEFLGLPDQGEAMDCPRWPDDEEAAEQLLAPAQPPFIGVYPGGQRASQGWTPERFAEAGRRLCAQAGGTVVVLGGEEERAAGGMIAQRIGAPCLDLTGVTSLPVLAAVVARLSVLLSDDSDPVYLAYALHAPSVTLRSLTDSARRGSLPPGPHRMMEAADLQRLDAEVVASTAQSVMR